MLSKFGVAVVLASLTALVHFLGEEIDECISGYKERIVSFGAGVSITYIFMQLLPEFNRLTTPRISFIFPLAGFSVLHLSEKHLAQEDIEKKKLARDYGEIHSLFLFIYSAAIGYLVAFLVSENLVSGVLFFIPILIHVAVSSFSLSELHQNFVERPLVKISISASPLLGVTAYGYGILPGYVFQAVFGLVVGMFIYVVVRDSIPRGEKGKPFEYLAGVLIYLVLILILKTF
jgi:hypothetical protein